MRQPRQRLRLHQRRWHNIGSQKREPNPESIFSKQEKRKTFGTQIWANYRTINSKRLYSQIQREKVTICDTLHLNQSIYNWCTAELWCGETLVVFLLIKKNLPGEAKSADRYKIIFSMQEKHPKYIPSPNFLTKYIRSRQHNLFLLLFFKISPSPSFINLW